MPTENITVRWDIDGTAYESKLNALNQKTQSMAKNMENPVKGANGFNSNALGHGIRDIAEGRVANGIFRLNDALGMTGGVAIGVFALIEVFEKLMARIKETKEVTDSLNKSFQAGNVQGVSSQTMEKSIQEMEQNIPKLQALSQSGFGGVLDKIVDMVKSGPLMEGPTDTQGDKFKAENVALQEILSLNEKITAKKMQENQVQGLLAEGKVKEARLLQQQLKSEQAIADLVNNKTLTGPQKHERREVIEQSNSFEQQILNRDIRNQEANENQKTNTMEAQVRAADAKAHGEETTAQAITLQTELSAKLMANEQDLLVSDDERIRRGDALRAIYAAQLVELQKQDTIAFRQRQIKNFESSVSAGSATATLHGDTRTARNLQTELTYAQRLAELDADTLKTGADHTEQIKELGQWRDAEYKIAQQQEELEKNRLNIETSVVGIVGNSLQAEQARLGIKYQEHLANAQLLKDNGDLKEAQEELNQAAAIHEQMIENMVKQQHETPQERAQAIRDERERAQAERRIERSQAKNEYEKVHGKGSYDSLTGEQRQSLQRAEHDKYVLPKDRKQAGDGQFPGLAHLQELQNISKKLDNRLVVTAK